MSQTRLTAQRPAMTLTQDMQIAMHSIHSSWQQLYDQHVTVNMAHAYAEGRDWAQFVFSNNPRQAPSMPVNNSDTPSRVCDAWQASDKQAYQYSYGPLVAYPAKKLKATCHGAQLLNSSYSCTYDGNNLPVITNFWSTNAVNTTTNIPYSSLLVDVQVLDDMNQTLAIGEHPYLTSSCVSPKFQCLVK